MIRIALALVLLVSLGTLVWAQPAEAVSDWSDFLILWGIIIAAALLFVFLKWLVRVLRLFLKR